MITQKAGSLVVGTRVNMSHLGVHQFRDLSHKTGTVVEVSIRTTASRCCSMVP
jgi:hypothetical protein